MSSKDKKKQTCFDKTWLEQKDLSQWVAKFKSDPTKYRCRICYRTNGLSNMGIGSVKIHRKAPSREANAKKIKNSFRSRTSPTHTHAVASHCHQPQHQGKIDEIVINSAVSKAEIRWNLKSVITGYSNHSDADCRSMFHESNIAKKYHLGPDKLRYPGNLWLGPYFKNILMESIRKYGHFVISFDESLNKTTQSSELDFLVRYFDVLKMKVSTRYVTLVFLSHSRHTDLYNSLTIMRDQLRKDKLVQLSMDGSSVNVKLLQGVQDDRKDKGLPYLLDIGTCGQHTLHGSSFKTGIDKSEWEINVL